jgi:putative copper resistance protein D
MLYLQLVATGLLFALPILGVDLLPAWCTPPVRAVIAFGDGLIDAIVGIVVMTSPVLVAGSYYQSLHRPWGPSPQWDQTIGGGLILTLTEAFGLPFLAAVLVEWMRYDAAEARRIDAQLDAELDAGLAAGLAAPAPAPLREADAAEPTAPTAPTAPADSFGPQFTRPWWETDPRFAGRTRD